jgi:hypothetical protein
MKKSLFFAFAVAGMLCSCSSEETIEAGVAGNDGSNNSEFVPIKLGMASSAITRGSGTVGGVEGSDENVWHEQIVKVFMLEKGKLEKAVSDVDLLKQVNEGVIFYNTPLKTPNGINDDYAYTMDESIKYYPTAGAFDFWAYHVDESQDAVSEAVISEPNEMTLENGSKALYVDVAIDGSQDIMVAKAVPSEENIAAVGDENRIYSAYAARKSVQPILEFKHLLSRLQFNVLAGDENVVAKNIYVKQILVKSKATGKLIVAYEGTESVDQLVMDSGAEYVNFELKRREESNYTNLIPLEDVLVDSQEGVSVGEALLVYPDEEYEMTIKLVQTIQTNKDEEALPATYEYNTKIKLPLSESGEIVKFEQGKSYNVNITVWGLEEINIKTVLKGWDNGGNVDITPEDDRF